METIIIVICAVIILGSIGISGFICYKAFQMSRQRKERLERRRKFWNSNNYWYH